ncbi:MAG: hypothetical protein RLO08_00735 [Parvibaculaceae bacterium]
MSITRDRSVPRALDGLKRQAPTAFAFAASVVMLFLAVPSFLSDVRLANAHLVRWQVEQGEDLDQRTLRRAAIAYENASRRWDADPRGWERSAILSILAAEASGQAGELGVARQHLERAVRRMPSHGAAWTRLVYTDFLEGRLDEVTFATWRMANLTSRLEFDDLRIRLWIGLLRWQDLPMDLRADLAASGAALWRAGGAGQKVLATVFRQLPRSARDRMTQVIPDGAGNIGLIAALAARLP